MHLGLISNIYLYSEKKIKKLANSPPFSLIKYPDSNYVGNSEDKNLVIRQYLFIYGALVS